MGKVARKRYAARRCSVGGDARRQVIELKRRRLSGGRQCTLLHPNRAGVYNRAAPQSETDLQLMRLVDEQFYGNAVLWVLADGMASASSRS